jgi:hypothetical protein
MRNPARRVNAKAEAAHVSVEELPHWEDLPLD